MQTKVKWFLVIALLIPCWVIGIKYEIDLVVLHATAQFLNNDFTRVYAQNGDLGRYFYGPFSLILIKPLGYLSFPVVKYFWLVLQTVCYFAFGSILTDLYPFLKEKRYFWGWFLIWIVAINPIHNNYQSNNIQLMLATLLVLAEKLTRSSSSSKQILGGILVTFTAGIKVFPAFLVLYYFIAKNNATRKGILLGGLIVIASPFLFLGPEKALFLYQGFFSNLITYSAENSLTKINDILCLPSLLARVGWSSKAINICILIVSALFYLWVYLSRPSFKEGRTEYHLLAMAWALSVLLNPSTRPHYFIFYIPAFCSILEVIYSNSYSKILTWGLIFSTLLIAFTAEGVVGKQWNEWLEHANFPTYGMVLLCLVLTVAVIVTQNSRDTQRVLTN